MLRLGIIALVAGLVPVLITVFNWYHWHPRMDTLAHASAGACLGTVGWLLTGHQLLTVLLVFVVALAWEYVEPRLGPLQTGSQDTEADVAVGTLAAAVVVLVYGPP